MFSDNEIRQSAYFSYSEWPGGLYATAQPAGSRSSAPIAGAWVINYTIKIIFIIYKNILI